MKRVLPEFITDVGSNFERTEYDPNIKNAVLQYMKTKGELCEAGGYVDDIITAKETRIEDGGFTDGIFVWSTQDIYHIEKYNASVKDEFIKHVLEKLT